MASVGDFVVDDESILIIDKFHYFIRAVLEKNLPLQEYILKFMQFAEKIKHANQSQKGMNNLEPCAERDEQLHTMLQIER